MEWFGPPPRPSPRKLAAYIDRLPRASHLRAAQSLDVEMYEAFEQQNKGRPRPPVLAPPATEFAPDVEVLAALFDRLGELIQVSIAAAGSKKKISVKPWPRPETARDIVRRRKARANIEHLESAIVFIDAEPAPPDPAAPVTATISRIRR